MRVGLGVTGGIAAYKAAELLRCLQENGLEVQVIMTRAAREFVTPLTFESLSGRKVITDLFPSPAPTARATAAEGSAQAATQSEPNAESAIEHIAVAQEIEALIIAPATADVLAKMAHGLADDFLTAVYLATRAPVIVAPAMNINMWQHEATQANIAILRQRGVKIIEPESGYLACGMVGAGRLAAIENIAQAVWETLGMRRDLENEILLVTAGPTHEPIDLVRHLSNRSSGKMGYALAEAAQRRGARVLLVSGPTHLTPPQGVEVERVRTSDEMADAVLNHLDTASIVIMAAAVADYQPASVIQGKIKKNSRPLSLELKPTRDILAEIAERRQPRQLVVGFAAESDHLIENAAEKMQAKRTDLMVANDITQEGAGFDGDTNIITLLFPDGHAKSLEKMSKFQAANRVLDELVELRKAGAQTAILTNRKS
jgi:phosphopantothenoylcysteine decarboxylase/phosphopantothenate--cysteine ligase